MRVVGTVSNSCAFGVFLNYYKERLYEIKFGLAVCCCGKHLALISQKIFGRCHLTLQKMFFELEKIHDELFCKVLGFVLVLSLDSKEKII